MSFDSDVGEKSKLPNSSESWPSSFNTAIPSCTVSKEGRIVPEPPARLHSRLNNSFNKERTITPSPSAYTINSLNNNNVICLAAAFTETWHARFFNGGGSSFSTAASTCQPPIQAIDGSLTLAFQRADVEKKLLNGLVITPLVLKITNAARLKDLQAKLSGSSIR